MNQHSPNHLIMPGATLPAPGPSFVNQRGPGLTASRSGTPGISRSCRTGNASADGTAVCRATRIVDPARNGLTKLSQPNGRESITRSASSTIVPPAAIPPVAGASFAVPCGQETGSRRIPLYPIAVVLGAGLFLAFMFTFDESAKTLAALGPRCAYAASDVLDSLDGLSIPADTDTAELAARIGKLELRVQELELQLTTSQTSHKELRNE